MLDFLSGKNKGERLWITCGAKGKTFAVLSVGGKGHNEERGERLLGKGRTLAGFGGCLCGCVKCPLGLVCVCVCEMCVRGNKERLLSCVCVCLCA